MGQSRCEEFLYKTDITVKTEVDEERCWITGMAFIQPCKLILADCRNISVKLVDTNDYCIVHRLPLDSYPLDITHVTGTECAVTIPVERTIKFISIESDVIKLTKDIEVDGDCRGISYNGKHLFVTYACPAKLQIMNLEGHVSVTVMFDKDGDLIFSEPYYVTANNNYIYVSDQGRHSVIILNLDGAVLESYKRKGSSHGITTLNNECILVSGLNIFKFNNNAEGNVIIGDLNFPYAVCWCNPNRELYISYHKGDEENDNFVQVFEGA